MTSGRPRGASLATRFALAIGAAVAAVIVVTIVVVSVGVLARFDAYLDQARAGRYAEVATLAADLVRERGSLDIRGQELRRLAIVAGGTLVLRDPAGAVVGTVREIPGLRQPGQGAGGGGRPGPPGVPGAPTEPTVDPVTVMIVVDGAVVGSLEITPLGGIDAAAPAPTAFREDASGLLVAAALAAVLVTILVTMVVARRLTGPVRSLAAATRRIEAGDLTARVDPPAAAEVHDLATSFNAMAARLEQSESLRRRGATDLAHELGTPITVLVGRLQALADGTLRADPPTLEATLEVAEEIGRLAGDLQDLAAAEGAALRRTVARIDLRGVVSRACAASQAIFDDAAVRLDLAATPGAPVHVDVDERQVERALRNLLTNAATYTPPGGSVVVTVTADGPVAAVRVRDTGPGIAPRDVPHVFERFFRGESARHPSRQGTAGTGIGLTVARDLVTANGGELAIEATSPSGTTFRAAFPIPGSG